MHWIPTRFNHLLDAHSKFKSRKYNSWIVTENHMMENCTKNPRKKHKTELVMLAKTKNIGMLKFLKIWVIPLHFYERPTLVPVSTNQKKSEEDVWFYEKKAKSKNSIQHLLCIEPFLEATRPRVERVAPPSSFPGTILSLPASCCCSLELYLWATVLYLNFCCVFLLLLHVSITLGFMCYLVWFGRLFSGSGDAKNFHIN